MNTTEIANLINAKADFQISVFDHEDGSTTVDARSLTPTKLSDLLDESPDMFTGFMLMFAIEGEMERVEPDLWVEHYLDDHTLEGYAHALTQLVGDRPIPGVKDTATGQDRLNAWSVHRALYAGEMQGHVWFPHTADFDALVRWLASEIADAAEMGE